LAKEKVTKKKGLRSRARRYVRRASEFHSIVAWLPSAFDYWLFCSGYYKGFALGEFILFASVPLFYWTVETYHARVNFRFGTAVLFFLCFLIHFLTP
jgi:hypothetical protein